MQGCGAELFWTLFGSWGVVSRPLSALWLCQNISPAVCEQEAADASPFRSLSGSCSPVQTEVVTPASPGVGNSHRMPEGRVRAKARLSRAGYLTSWLLRRLTEMWGTWSLLSRTWVELQFI